MYYIASIKIEDDNTFLKYTEIWNKIKKTLNIKFFSQPIYDDKYIKINQKHLMTLHKSLHLHSSNRY